MDWLAFCSSVIQSLAWPVAVIVLIVRLGGSLKQFAPRLRKLKYKDIELEFGEKLEKGEAQAVDAELPPAPPLTVSHGEGVPEPSERQRLVELAKTSPNTAIGEAWRRLEHEIRTALEDTGVAAPANITEMLELARSQGVLPDRVMELVANLRDLRNRAVFASHLNIDLAKAIEYIDLADRVRAFLARTPVKSTGAPARTILQGAFNFNEGLRVRVHEQQPPGWGGRIVGEFELLDAGTGKYAPYLKGFVGHTFASAKELIDRVSLQPGAEKCTHILNCNTLMRETVDVNTVTGNGRES
jgi:hypothetical protein